MKETKPLVIVLSRNYSTGLSVVRSLGAAGFTVDLVANVTKKSDSQIAACSKYVHRAVEVVSPKLKAGRKDTSLLDALMQYTGRYDRKPVLFPTDDSTTSVIDQNRTVLQEHFIMPTIAGGGDGCLTDRMDKTFQTELARKTGLLTPKEWTISLERKIKLPEDMIYPCFCKPIESVTGYKREMKRCETPEELLEHLEKLQQKFANRSILVQEFLEIDNEIDIGGVCFDQEVIIPAVICKQSVAQHSRGVTLSGQIMPLEDLGPLKEKIMELLRQFHYVGMFDMELNVVGENVYFNEVNLRSGGPNFAYFMSGVNLPALYVKEVLGIGHTSEEEQVSTYYRTFVYEKVAWEDYIHGYMTRRELNQRLKSADITLLCNSDDPAPGDLFMKLERRAQVIGMLRGIKHGLKRCICAVHAPLAGPLHTIKGVLLGYPQYKKANRRNPDAVRPRVLVAGRNYCSNLCMARSVGKAGYEVEVLRVFQVRPKWRKLLSHLRPEAYSCYVKAYHVCISCRKSRRIVDKLIEIADPCRKMLLIPADDLVANIADEYMKELGDYYLLPNVNNTPSELTRLMNKRVQDEMAAAAGLPTIHSCEIRTVSGCFEIPETITYPCFLKPNVSKDSSKSQMRRVDSEEELRTTLEEYSRNKDVDVLVQDFIDIRREYSILGLSTRDGAVAPGFFGVLEGGHGAHRGVAMTGELVPGSRYQGLIDDACRFVESLKFDGLFDVDLIEDTSGRMYFVELNLRYGASGYAVTEFGANMPGMFADYMLLGKPIDKDCKVNGHGGTFISERVMIEEYASGDITAKEAGKRFASADIHFIYDAVDKKPYRHFRRYYPAAALLRLMHWVKNRMENR